MALASRRPQRGDIWCAHASAILPILQAAAACSLVGLSEAMLSDKTSLETASPRKLPQRPCLIIDDLGDELTLDVVVFTTCGGGSQHISQLGAQSQHFAVAAGRTRPWPAPDSPVLNVLPAWPKSFHTPSYVIAYIITIPRSALLHPWTEDGYPGAVFRCENDAVEKLEEICETLRITYSSLGEQDGASWNRSYEVSRREWLAGRPPANNLSTIASHVYAHRHAISEQPRSAGRPVQDSDRRAPRAPHRPPPLISPPLLTDEDSFPPLQSPTTGVQPPKSPTTGVQSPTGHSHEPPLQTQGGQRPRGPSNSQEAGVSPARNDEDADTPDTTPTDSPSSLSNSLSTSDSEASPGASSVELNSDDPDEHSTSKDPANHLLLSLDGDDAEAVSGTISYSQIVSGLAVRHADKPTSNLTDAVADPQQGKKKKRFSRVNILTVGLRMGPGTRTTAF